MNAPAVVAADDATVAEAARLVAAAYPVPSLEMNAAYLRWHLTATPAGAALPPLLVACHDRGTMIAFAGATPRSVEIEGEHYGAYVVSFVAVAESHRGRGLAGALYDTLLPAVRNHATNVLTFAVAESPGERAIMTAYPRCGFSGHALRDMPPWAVLRGRVRTADGHAASDAEPTLRLVRTGAMARQLDADPRGTADVGNGARVVAARRLTATGPEPLLLLELLPERLDAHTLSSALRAAFEAFPNHGKQLVVPNFPEDGASAAAAVGLRRLAGPVYRAWIWSTDPSGATLRAGRTDHPVV